MESEVAADLWRRGAATRPELGPGGAAEELPQPTLRNWDMAAAR